MSTEILITPPGGQQHRVKVFDTCQTNLSATDKAGSFGLELPAFDNSLIDAFPVGSDVQISQDGNAFRGWVISPPKTVNGRLKNVSLQGSTYTSRTQKIIVTESYTNTAVSDIVHDLFTKYVPWATRVNIQSCPKVITIRFGDSYLWDAMERLCQIAAYDWYIDEELDVNFFNGLTRINPTVLSRANRNFKKGTANFMPDASKLVNKLWVKGGKATSEPYEQAITVSGTTPIPILYTPRAPDGESVIVRINGLTKTVGIQNIDKTGTKDFLLNAREKLLVPDLCTSGIGSITYRYEYPIKILLEDQESQAKYGLFEDVLKVETDDKILAKEQGMQHLARYSNPVITGSIQPMKGIYRPGELIKIEIPDLKINEYMQIREIACESLSGLGTVNRTLQLSSRERDAVSILKDMNNRLAKLEKSTFNDDDGPVEKYVYFGDSIKTPGLVDDGLSWSLHQYHICGQTMCSAGVMM